MAIEHTRVLFPVLLFRLAVGAGPSFLLEGTQVLMVLRISLGNRAEGLEGSGLRVSP